MSYKSKEIRIALVAIIALVFMFFGIKFLKGLSLVASDSTYYIEFNNVSGLTPSCIVLANGYQVGTITKIDFDYKNPSNIRVRIDVNKKLNIPRETTASVESDLLGNIKVVLDLKGDPTDCLEPGSTIPELTAKGALAQAADMVPVIMEMLPKMDSILISVNQLLSSPALTASLNNIEGMTSNLKTTSSDLNRLMSQLNGQVPGLMIKADGVLGNAESITSNLASTDFNATMQKIDATMANVQILIDKMNSPEGTVGKLLSDPQVYDNLNATMADADSLMLDLKAHPKRYVHFSVFGKKDK